MEQDLQNVDFVMYEMNHDIGGTWVCTILYPRGRTELTCIFSQLLNKYPGCACDIPSHAYTYSFALNVTFLAEIPFKCLF